MINLDNFSLANLLPSSLLQTKEDHAMAQALTEIFKYVFSLSSKTNSSNDIPENLLDIVAWGESVDFYKSSMTPEQKRKLISVSSILKSKKGTAFAVEEAAKIFIEDAYITEWFDYEGEKYHFKLKTSDRTISEERLYSLINAIESVKRKSTRLDKVSIEISEQSTIHFTGFIHTGDSIRLGQK